MSLYDRANRICVLAEMRREVVANCLAKGWEPVNNSMGDLVALLHSEVSKILEAWRDYKGEPHDTDGKPDDIGSEMADVLIRLLHMAWRFDVDLAKEFDRKMAYNRTRPFQHGGRTL